jgi:hypothetical protein
LFNSDIILVSNRYFTVVPLLVFQAAVGAVPVQYPKAEMFERIQTVSALGLQVF